jgi:hypothetical protein
LYTWNAFPQPFPHAPADGQAFTIFLAALNSGGCFAGQCDWRLPTLAELETILQAMTPSPCDTSPCIDEEVFGPTVAIYYWSDTTYVNKESSSSAYAWTVNFDDGGVIPFAKNFAMSVRAVRGGL